MKEKLYTIEANEALRQQDECLFCYLERKMEQQAIDYVLGSSYMESDVRSDTSATGFCREHTKKMYDYGNALGNAWILKSRLDYVRRQFSDMEKQPFSGEKIKTLFRKKDAQTQPSKIRALTGQCYICRRLDKILERMMDSLFYLLKHDAECLQLLEQSKGFCLRHFPDVLEYCETSLSDKEREKFVPLIFEIMKKNLDRVQEEIDWFIEKYDYRNAQADWKNSKDAIPRTMQKLTGGYPADHAYKAR